jgi:hypothetical protein
MVAFADVALTVEPAGSVMRSKYCSSRFVPKAMNNAFTDDRLGSGGFQNRELGEIYHLESAQR